SSDYEYQADPYTAHYRRDTGLRDTWEGASNSQHQRQSDGRDQRECTFVVSADISLDQTLFGAAEVMEMWNQQAYANVYVMQCC
ncbi:MAG TPA: hypothetical protein VFT66_08490, partial [Roseiflexaceae bacterium]|nr:hypothetical protein [Roseiflexaceae bacterium]